MPSEGSVTIKWLDVASGKSQALNANVQDGKLSIDDPNPHRRTLFTLRVGQTTVTLAEREWIICVIWGPENRRWPLYQMGLAYRADTLYKAKPEGYSYFKQHENGLCLRSAQGGRNC